MVGIWLEWCRRVKGGRGVSFVLNPLVRGVQASRERWRQCCYIFLVARRQKERVVSEESRNADNEIGQQRQNASKLLYSSIVYCVLLYSSIVYCVQYSILCIYCVHDDVCVIARCVWVWVLVCGVWSEWWFLALLLCLPVKVPAATIILTVCRWNGDYNFQRETRVYVDIRVYIIDI